MFIDISSMGSGGVGYRLTVVLELKRLSTLSNVFNLRLVVFELTPGWKRIEHVAVL